MHVRAEAGRAERPASPTVLPKAMGAAQKLIPARILVSALDAEWLRSTALSGGLLPAGSWVDSDPAPRGRALKAGVVGGFLGFRLPPPGPPRDSSQREAG